MEVAEMPRPEAEEIDIDGAEEPAANKRPRKRGRVPGRIQKPDDVEAIAERRNSFLPPTPRLERGSKRRTQSYSARRAAARLYMTTASRPRSRRRLCRRERRLRVSVLLDLHLHGELLG
ncbi:unnamed protein product [Phaeothamnion confervicola]